jgi:hypothetical protein
MTSPRSAKNRVLRQEILPLVHARQRPHHLHRGLSTRRKARSMPHALASSPHFCTRTWTESTATALVMGCAADLYSRAHRRIRAIPVNKTSSRHGHARYGASQIPDAYTGGTYNTKPTRRRHRRAALRICSNSVTMALGSASRLRRPRLPRHQHAAPRRADSHPATYAVPHEISGMVLRPRRRHATRTDIHVNNPKPSHRRRRCRLLGTVKRTNHPTPTHGGVHDGSRARRSRHRHATATACRHLHQEQPQRES